MNTSEKEKLKREFYDKFGEWLDDEVITITNDNPVDIAEFWINKMEFRNQELVKRLEANLNTRILFSKGAGGSTNAKFKTQGYHQGISDAITVVKEGYE